jgi:hypothetical protein
MGSLKISLITRYNSGDETDGVCDRYGKRERCTQGFYWGNLTEGDHLEDLGVGDGIILKRSFGMDM